MPGVEKRSISNKTMLRVIVGLPVAAIVIVFAGFVFMHASRLGWTLGWIYVGIVGVTLAINLVCLRLWNPELIRRRMRVSKFSKTWDKVWAVLYAPVMIAVYMVAGLEARDGISSLPVAAWPLGLAAFVPGAAMFTWSMVVNPFFNHSCAA